jgi:hypothetical protein
MPQPPPVTTSTVLSGPRNESQRGVTRITSPTHDEHCGFVRHNIGDSPDVYERGCELTNLEEFSKPQDWSRAAGGTTGAIGLLIVVGLVLFAIGNIRNSLVGPTDLPFLGQFLPRKRWHVTMHTLPPTFPM